MTACGAEVAMYVPRKGYFHLGCEGRACLEWPARPADSAVGRHEFMSRGIVYDMCAKMSELSAEYLAAMRAMDNAPKLPAAEMVEIATRVIELRRAVSEHARECAICLVHGASAGVSAE